MEDFLPVHTSPEDLEQFCEDANGVLPNHPSNVETALNPQTLAETIKYGIRLGFLERTDDQQIDFSQYGRRLAQGRLSYDDVQEGFESGIMNYKLYRSLFYRTGDKLKETEHGEVHLSGEVVANAIGFNLDFELTEGGIKEGAKTFLKTLEAANLGRYYPARKNKPERLVVTDEYKEFLSKLSSEMEPADDDIIIHEVEDPQETDGSSREVPDDQFDRAIRVSAIHVQNYRNILDSGEVPLSKVTTVIGKNEAGKTSFLEAIASFDSTEPYTDQELCKFRENRPKHETPIVSLRFDVHDPANAFFQRKSEEQDFEDSKSFTITKFADSSYELTAGPQIQKIFNRYSDHCTRLKEIAQTIDKKFGNVFPIAKASEEQKEVVEDLVECLAHKDIEPLNKSQINCVIRKSENALMQTEELRDQSRSWDDLSSGIEEHVQSLQETFYPALFDISYIDEYTLIEDKVNINDIGSDENHPVANLLAIGGTTPDEIQSTEGFDRQELLMEVSDRVTKTINSNWTQKQIDLDLRNDGDTIRLYIEDEVVEDKAVSRQRIPISDRSTGFRAFLSSLFRTMENKRERIGCDLLLFDDAAVYLHPSGKRDWLSAIEGLSEKRQIIYTTHSPYLIRKTALDRVRPIVETENGARVQTEVFNTEKQTFEPIRDALGIRLGDSPFISKRQIVVEGPSDYYILTGVIEYYRDELRRQIVDFDEVAIVPAGGAQDVPNKAMLFATEDIDYAMVLDSDDEGRNAEEEIKTEYHRLERGEERTVLLSNSTSDEDVVIEDMFDPDFYVDCFNDTYSSISESFSRVNVEELDDSRWDMDGYEYQGQMITEILEEILEDQNIKKELAKVKIASTVQSRLRKGEATEEDVDEFQELLIKLREMT